METVTPRPVFKSTLERFQIPGIAEIPEGAFEALFTLVMDANERMNLTRITTPEDFLVNHLLDSLSLVPILNRLPQPFTLADVGTGAGFPLLPLALVYPSCKFVGIESVQKKADFVTEAAQSLQLENVTMLAERSEILAHEAQWREQFDIVTARAVSPLNTLVELCLPLVKLGGLFLAMKTQSSAIEECQTAEEGMITLGGMLETIHPVDTPPLPNRAIIAIQKAHTTPKHYPRKPGTAKKSPL